MRSLYLLRHAKSSWADPDLADHDRPLARRGERAADRIAAHLAEQGIHIDLVLCSSARRARQTLERITPALGRRTAIRFEDSLYTADARGLLMLIQQVPSRVDALLVIGHDPAIQTLAVQLAGRGPAQEMEKLRAKLPTAGLATLSVEARWSDLRFGAARLESLVSPRELEG